MFVYVTHLCFANPLYIKYVGRQQSDLTAHRDHTTVSGSFF